MATDQAVAASLKLLARAFAGTVDKERVALYCAALDDLDDTALARATSLVIRNHTGEFIPPPAVLRKAIAPAPVAVDAAAILRRIEQLSVYNANTGMIPPAVATVRGALGEAVAYAYAAAGGPRALSDNDVTRDIAAREFANALRDAVARPGARLPVLGSPGARGELTFDGGRDFAALVADVAAARAMPTASPALHTTRATPTTPTAPTAPTEDRPDAETD